MSNSGANFESLLPPSVLSGGLINAKQFATAGVVNMSNLIEAMEKERKGAYFPENMTMNSQVLLNKVNSSSPSTFQYAFYGIAGSRTQLKLPAMSSGQFAFRINQNSSGVKENSALYNHPDITFENIEFIGSGSTDGGSVASSYNRTFRIVNCQLKSLANGFVNSGFSDLTYVDSFTGDHTVTGWGIQVENGDGQYFHNIQFYASKGVLSKHGSGTVSQLVSGEHKFIVSKFIIVDDHLEGDGPNEAGGKSQVAPIILEGGDYLIKGCRLYTTTNPNRPSVEVNDEGATARSTLLRFENARFMQRINNPANPEGLIEPVGNLQGIALKLQGLSTRSTVEFINTHAEAYQQTGEESRFDERYIIGFKISASETGLQEQCTNRRVMLSSSDAGIRYNTGSASWEIRPIGGMQDSITTRKFSAPNISLSKYTVGSAEAKGAPTTRKAGTHYYVAWSIDDRGRRTNLGTERSITISEGEVPVPTLEAGYPCRVIIEHGTTAGTFTEYTEVIIPLGQAVIPDMGNAMGGQEWLSSGLPSKPSTSLSENNTAAGYVLLDSAGHAVSYVASVFTSGEWQKEGDILFLNGIPARCITSATGNNGGTWILLPANVNTLSEGESTIARGECTTTAVTMSTKVHRLGFFTALKAQSTGHARATCSAAYVGVPTLIQFSAYSVNSSTGELTLVGKTASNTSLFATAGEAYEVSWEASWTKVAGERYALGLLVITTGTAPTIGGQSNSLASSELAKTPRLSAAQSGTESIPGSITSGSLVASSAIPYIVAAP